MAKAKKKQTEEQELAGEIVVAETMDEGEDPREAHESAEEADGEELAITQDDVRLVEAILFASSSAVSVAQIAERFPEDRAVLIPGILEIIREQYGNRGVNLVQRDSRFALRTATDLGDSLRLEKDQPRKFTRAAQETLAVVAYHQPVTRAEIENIRGVATSPGALDALLEAGWIKPGKRREVPGRPVTWLTTQAFLDHFGLEKLEDLPGMDELKAAGLLDKRPAIEAMPQTGDLFDGEGEQADNDEEVTDEDLIGRSFDENGAEDEDSGADEDDDDNGGDDDDIENDSSEEEDSLDDEAEDEDEDEDEDESDDDDDDDGDDEDDEDEED